MGVTSCHSCGADIRWAETTEDVSGITRVSRIPIDNLPSYPLPGTDEPRYIEVTYDPLVVRRVGPGEQGYGRHKCR